MEAAAQVHATTLKLRPDPARVPFGPRFRDKARLGGNAQELSPPAADWTAMQQQELIAKMRGRVAQCRRLADATTDDRTAAILRAMADEAEADIMRLLAENEGPDARPAPGPEPS